MNNCKVWFFCMSKILEFRLAENVGWMLCRDFLLCLKLLGLKFSVQRTSAEVSLQVWVDCASLQEADILLDRLGQLLLEKKIPIQLSEILGRELVLGLARG